MNRIFFSYARDDNLAVEEDKQGWVTFLFAALEIEFLELGLSKSTIWRDKRDILPHEQFAEEIEEGLKSSHLLVSVLSPAYIQRDWCMKELHRFSELSGSERQQQRERIFKVVKRAVDEEPEPLRGQEGYRFFALNQEDGREKPFYHSGIGAEPQYFDVVRALASDLHKRLEMVQNDSSTEVPRSPQPERTVFLAYTSSDMANEVRQIRGELENAGLRVLPESDDRPPLSLHQMESELNAGLSEAEFSVHVLGKTPGLVPDGAQNPISVLQLQAAADLKLRRVIWIPKITERDQRVTEVTEKLGRGEGMNPDDELIEEGLDRLKGFLKSVTGEKVKATANSPVDLLQQIKSMSAEERAAVKSLLDMG